MNLTAEMRRYWLLVLHGFEDLLELRNRDESVTPGTEYRCFAWFVMAHHLSDHLIGAQSIDKTTVHQHIKDQTPLARCRDIATSTKHFQITTRRLSDVGPGRPNLTEAVHISITENVTSGASSADVQHTLHLAADDGTLIDIFDLARGVLSAWCAFGLGIAPDFRRKHRI